MSYKIYRRIHPVGQGQCISESHLGEKLPFAKVYFDCGAGNNANKKELDRITQEFVGGGINTYLSLISTMIILAAFLIY